MSDILIKKEKEIIFCGKKYIISPAKTKDIPHVGILLTYGIKLISNMNDSNIYTLLADTVAFRNLLKAVVVLSKMYEEYIIPKGNNMLENNLNEAIEKAIIFLEEAPPAETTVLLLEVIEVNKDFLGGGINILTERINALVSELTQQPPTSPILGGK